MDFGATDGPMNDDADRGGAGNVVHIPTVLGAVVVTYNLPSLGATRLKLDGTDGRGHLHGPDHQVERPADRRAQPRRDAAQAWT